MPAKPRFSLSVDDLPALREQLRMLPGWYTQQAKDLFTERLGAYKVEMVARSTSGPVFRKTGKLAGSYGATVTGASLATLDANLAVYSQTKAYTLEFGGTIYPTGGARAWIFIPTDVNRKLNGQPIKSVTQVRSEGGKFINRFARQFREGNVSIAPQAVIDGKLSPAWNLLLDASNVPMFIQTKWITHIPRLGFFDTGVKHAARMTGKLADFMEEYWKAAA